MKKLITLLLAALLAFGLVACAGGGEDTAGTVGGTVKCNGAGLEGVSIMIDGQSAATTDANGAYSLGEYTGNVTLTPVKEGYTFMPESLTVQFARPDADFTATAVAGTDEPATILKTASRPTATGISSAKRGAAIRPSTA